MKKNGYQEAIDQIISEDPRYDEHAYIFIREALDFTIQNLEKPSEGPGRHVSGRELLEGARQYALSEYGPLAARVLNHWGIHECEDFGEIVFNLVDKGILGKTDEDTKDDFSGGYEFDEAFRAPFQPTQSPNRLPVPSK